MTLKDKTLTCIECGQEFIFTAGEQEFYLSRNLMNEPKRCPECRATRRQERRSGSGYSRSSYTVICAACGVETTVPFEPTEGRPVYCRDCYNRLKESGELGLTSK